MQFQVLGPIAAVETIAEGHAIRDLATLRLRYGLGHWRKKKGIARVRTATGRSGLAEIHWYEAHGIGRVELKIKEWR